MGLSYSQIGALYSGVLLHSRVTTDKELYIQKKKKLGEFLV
jgi:hypothetical protein